MTRRIYNMVAVAPGLQTLENFRVNTDLDGCEHGMTIIARGEGEETQPWHLAVGSCFEGMIMLCQSCGINCLTEEGKDAFVVLPDCRRIYSLDGRMNPDSDQFQQHILADSSARSWYNSGPPARFSEARISCMKCLGTSTGELLASFFDKGEIVPPLARALAEDP